MKFNMTREPNWSPEKYVNLASYVCGFEHGDTSSPAFAFITQTEEGWRFNNALFSVPGLADDCFFDTLSEAKKYAKTYAAMWLRRKK